MSNCCHFKSATETSPSKLDSGVYCYNLYKLFFFCFFGGWGVVENLLAAVGFKQMGLQSSSNYSSRLKVSHFMRHGISDKRSSLEKKGGIQMFWS